MTITAIDTDDELLAVVDYGKVWAPGLPFDESDPLDWQDKQQVLHLYPFEVTVESAPGPRRRSDDSATFTRRPASPSVSTFRKRNDDTRSLVRRAPESPTQTGG